MARRKSDESDSSLPRRVGQYLEAEGRSIRRLMAGVIFALGVCVVLSFGEPAILGGIPAVLYVGGLQLGYRWSTYRQVRDAQQWRRGQIVVTTSGFWYGARASGSLEIEGQSWALRTVRKKNGIVPTAPVRRYVTIGSAQRSGFRPTVAREGQHAAWRCGEARTTPRTIT